MKLDQIRALIEAATPGPWHDDPVNDKVWVDQENAFEGNSTVCEVSGLGIGNCNLRFIAASRDLMPKLLRVAEAAKLVLHADCPGMKTAQERRDDLFEAILAVESPEALAALEADP